MTKGILKELHMFGKMVVGVSYFTSFEEDATDLIETEKQ